jgi:hypothetical protein
MSAERIADAHGAAWPVTGRWCATCGMPLAVEAGGQIHQGCQAAGPDLSDAEYDEVLALLATTLVAHEIDPAALGTWRRTGRPVVDR